MTIKPFAIQGADLTLGGVNLQAGTTGVVIPGVTQAASFKVEEVNDTNDQTHVFAADSEVVVVDYVLYTAIVNQTDETLYADYTATTDDEGYIDDIEVNGQGNYTGQQATDNAANDMYAYIGSASASDRPLVPQDWIQIPFRPKMRAGEVENIGGGAGSITLFRIPDTEINNVTRIAIGGDGATLIDNGEGAATIEITGGSGLTTITGDQIGNQIVISTAIDGATPNLENASSIDYIPTTTLEANGWIVTSDPGTYSSVRFADGSTFVITGWNTDAYPNTGNGTSGFLSLDASGLNYLGAQVWPITITSYNYVASTVSGKGIEIDGSVWKFDGNLTLTVPGEIQSNNYNNLVLRSNDNINLYAGDAPGDDSEGGDINIVAGQGDPDNGGGDVQIRAGRGGNPSNEFDTGNSGGYVQLQGGYSSGSNSGGYVELSGGSSARGQGGRVDITGGYGSDDMLKLANVSITDIILNTPVQVTLAVDHNLNDGDAISFAGILTTVQLNNTKYYTYLIDNTTVALYQNRELTIPVSGTGMTAYNTPGVATETFTNNNGQSNNTFSQYISSAPTIGNIQVGWTVTGPGLNGTKTVTAINPEDPVNITVDGNDGSVFINTETYTFTEPSTTGLGTAYSSAHGGDINLEPGGTLNGGWGDIGRILIRGETQIGNNGGTIWKFGVDGKTTFPTLSVDLHNGGVQPGQTLQFADPTKQAIISGPAPIADNDAQRLIIQGHRATTGEGGDVYLWAGDSDTDGGDIKIYAGDADASPGNGGYINIDAGNGYANGGDVTITAGGSALNGGDVRITAGTASQGVSGRIELSSVGGSWIFGADGKLVLPSGGDIVANDGVTSVLGGGGTPGPQGPQGDPGLDGNDGADGASFVFAGQWDFSHPGYNVGDVVRDDSNNLYIAIQFVPQTTVGLDNTGYWQSFLQSGAQGPQGDPGPAGADGVGVTSYNDLTNKPVVFSNSTIVDGTATVAIASSNNVVDSFAISSYRTAKYIIQATSGGDVHSVEVVLIHNDVTASVVEYAPVQTAALITISSSVVNGLAQLLITTLENDTVIDFARISLTARALGALEGDLLSQSGTEDLSTGTGTVDLNA